MKLRSRFSWMAYLPVVLLLPMIAGVIIFAGSMAGKNGKQMAVTIAFMIMGVFIIVLMYGELKKKALTLRVYETKIIVSNFLGLSKSKTYARAEFDGYEIREMHTTYGNYEYIDLMSKGKKMITISDAYFSNYQELDDELTRNLPQIAKRKYSYAEDFREIFN